ncbi:hypothetical protein Q8A73_009483 [Channa argus]|nr:hypothetical protein Q8A73_009483 [Channa argus]
MERFNQTLKQMLRKFVNDTGSDWDQWLPYLLFADWEVPQASTGFSPFKLMNGYKVRGPLLLLREIWEGDQGSMGPVNIESYVLRMRERLEKMSGLAKAHMVEAQQNHKTWYDRSARQRTFAPGQKVLVLLPTEDSKLVAKWQGPFEIQEQLGPTTYKVATPGHKHTTKILHENLLKEWVSRPERPVEVLFIKSVQEEEEVDEQYLPSSRTADRHLHLLSEEKQSKVRMLCTSDVFQENPGRTNMVEHDVILKDGPSVRRMSYRIPERLLVSLKKEVDLMSLGIIQPSRSEWCNPMVLVPKKDGTIRFCIDFRYLNSVSQFDSYPTPRIDDLIERLGKAKYLTIDLCKGYWQGPLAHGATWEEHLEHLRVVLQQLKSSGLTVNPAMCAIATMETEYLGFVIGNGVVRPQVDKGAEDDWHPVAYISRKLFPREVRYSTVEKEALAIKWALEYYLLGREFTLETDHKALQWLERMKDTNGRITRWYLDMQPFRFSVYHIPGRSNVTADYLSRCASQIPEEGGVV